MSTDLELCQDLPKIRISAIKVRPSSATIGDGGLENCGRNGSDSDDNSECRTPTSEEHRIPTALSCPPAPRKPRRTASCKRKLSELQFFEIVDREEIDGFFRASFDVIAKRRCPCK